MRPQSAKAKGRRFQQQVARALLAQFSELGVDDIRSTSMGCGGEDLLLSPRARELLPYSFECKNQERINLWASLEQNDRNAKGFIPALVVSRNRATPRVVISLQHFVELARRAGPAAAVAAPPPPPSPLPPSPLPRPPSPSPPPPSPVLPPPSPPSSSPPTPPPLVLAHACVARIQAELGELVRHLAPGH
jgi:hypothetical protein